MEKLEEVREKYHPGKIYHPDKFNTFNSQRNRTLFCGNQPPQEKVTDFMFI